MAVTSKKKKPRGKKATKPGSGASWSARAWIGLMVIVSIWMFGFGVMVGRGTISSPFNFKNTQKELYAQAEKADRIAQEQASSRAPDKKKASDSFETLKKKERAVTSKKAPVDQQAPKKRLKEKEPPRKLPEKAPPKKTAMSPENKKTPAAAPVRPKEKKRKQNPVVLSYETIQVAAMKNLSDAKRMVAQLLHKGYPAYLASAVVPGKGMIHRIRVGPYKSKVKAKDALSRLKKQGVQGLLLEKR